MLGKDGRGGWRRWVQRPQSLWVRKALAKIHLWIGIGVGMYVLLISVSGSAIVFRRELARYSRKSASVAQSGRRISREELQQRAQSDFPSYEIYGVYDSERPERPVEVVLGDGKTRISRLFDPYTGRNLGDPQSFMSRTLGWLIDLHDNLLAGMTGRLVNGIGALFVTLLSLTGIIIWWPGIRHWRRAIVIHRKARFARFNWDLHSAAGFWCSAFVFVWGLSGICLCFPAVLNPVLSNDGVFWITQLHFGRFDRVTEAIWTILGLAPALLAITGALMWWNRVLRKRIAIRRSANSARITWLPARAHRTRRRAASAHADMFRHSDQQ